MRDYRRLDSLLAVMARLRDPKEGCPWDLEQDFRTIAPCTLEEAYEVADAIERGDMEDLKEELGDLLLQVVFHAQMATEASHFNFGDVVQAIVEKLIRRHPHVFGKEVRNSADEVVTRWEEIKAAEKRSKGPRRLLDEVPRNLPGLQQATKLQRKVASAGFDGPEAGRVAGSIRDRLEALEREAAKADSGRLEADMEALLFSCANLSRKLGLDPEASLRSANHRFRERFRCMEDACGDAGLPGQKELEALWFDACPETRGCSD